MMFLSAKVINNVSLLESHLIAGRGRPKDGPSIVIEICTVIFKLVDYNGIYQILHSVHIYLVSPVVGRQPRGQQLLQSLEPPVVHWGDWRPLCCLQRHS